MANSRRYAHASRCSPNGTLRAETALSAAKAALQRHHLECELDGADDKVRVKLETAIASCALTRDGYAAAIADLREKIGETEQKLTIDVPCSCRGGASNTDITGEGFEPQP